MSTNLNFTNIRLSRELSKLQSDSDKLEGIIIETPTDLMIWHKTLCDKDFPKVFPEIQLSRRWGIYTEFIANIRRT